MKTKFVIVFFLAISAIGFSQKQALKAAAKAIKSGQIDEATEALKSAEGQLDVADDKMKAQYYFLNAELASTDAGDSLEKIEASAMSYLKVLEIEKTSGSVKFTKEAASRLSTLQESLRAKAIDDQNNKDNKAAAEKLYLGYKISKKDTAYLYYAASNAVNAKEYDTALKYYEELVDIGYDGNQIVYKATNKESGKVEPFDSKQFRDLSVKAGTHIKPVTENSGSKKSEITKNIVLIYVTQEKNEEAMKALEIAKLENPDDTSLMQVEASVYHKLGDLEKYNGIMEQVVAKDPENPDLLSALGDSAFNLGDKQKAMSYYKKVVELKPENSVAQLNVASIIIGEDTVIVDEMNALGTSSSDNKKYDELKLKRENLYKAAVPYLEGALKYDPDNINAIKGLLDIYYQLDDPKADEMKNKLKALEGGN